MLKNFNIAWPLRKYQIVKKKFQNLSTKKTWMEKIKGEDSDSDTDKDSDSDSDSDSD